MPISSMTGFARVEGRSGPFEWTWELRSVNGRGLDVRSRLPTGFDALERSVRAAASDRFTRGNLQVSLVFDRSSTPQELRINHGVLEQVLRELSSLQGTPGTSDASLDGVLALRGVLELQEPEHTAEEIEARDGALDETLRDAVTALGASRQAEGLQLDGTLREQLSEIDALTSQAETLAVARQATAKERLFQQLDELLEERPGVPEERLAQEIALLLVKSDISEEVQRLRAHVLAARNALDSEEATGRRLDFLAQEFNREANTLCSKSGDTALTAVGLELKVIIDRFREQVQNVE